MNDRLEIFISSLIFIQANGNFNQNYGNNSNQKVSELLSAIHSHADNAILKLDDLHGQMSVVEYSTLYSVSIYDSICKKTCDLTVLLNFTGSTALRKMYRDKSQSESV